MPHFEAALILCDGPQSVCGMCFSLNLNKSSSYLSLCLSLNSFCDETSRTWGILNPETRFHGFWLGSSPSHMCSSPKLGSGWFQVPIPGLKSQAGFWLALSASHVCWSPKLDFVWVQVPVCGFKSQSEVNGFRNSDKLNFLGLQNHCGHWLQPWN